MGILFNKTIILAGMLLVATIALDDSALAAGHHRLHQIHRVALQEHSRSHRIRGTARIARGVRRGRGHIARAYGLRRIRSTQAATLIESAVGPSSAYVPASTGGYVQTGRASFYSGGRTASGGSVGAATCAHRSLPFGTRVLVTNLANRRQAVLTVNDRGPFVRGRVVDVSRSAAGTLGMLGAGVASVRVQVIGRAS